MADKTIFEKFWDDPASAHAIYVDTENGFMVIPDGRPVTPNHVMVIPKEPVAVVDDMPDDRYQQLWELVRITRRHLIDVLQPERGVGTVVWGMIVPHTHIHVFARAVKGDGQLFFNGDRPPATAEDLAALQTRLAFPPELCTQTASRLKQIGQQYHG
jgi:diadenosine tetraphosphate (Ap4A) HIT family hydrolase